MTSDVLPGAAERLGEGLAVPAFDDLGAGHAEAEDVAAAAQMVEGDGGMAVAVGVRADSWTIEVPSRIRLVCEPHQASGVKASAAPRLGGEHGVETRAARPPGSCRVRRPGRPGAPVAQLQGQLHVVLPRRCGWARHPTRRRPARRGGGASGRPERSCGSHVGPPERPGRAAEAATQAAAPRGRRYCDRRGSAVQPGGRGVPGRGGGVARRPPDRRVRRARWRGAARGASTRASTIRLAWEQELGKAGWIGLGWPVEYGGRGATLVQQVIFAEEYTRAGAPGAGQPHGREPARPDAHRLRHGRAAGAVPAAPSCGARSSGARATPSPTPAPTWPTCRPGPCSDDGDDWRHHRPEGVDLARPVGRTGASSCAAPTPGSPRHRACRTCSCPMRQPGVEIRPIVQITGTSEFNEVFFDEARAPTPPTSSARSATAGRSRWARSASSAGVSTLAQQIGFEHELGPDHRPGAGQRRDRPTRSLRQRLADCVDRPAAACGTTPCGP